MKDKEVVRCRCCSNFSGDRLTNENYSYFCSMCRQYVTNGDGCTFGSAMTNISEKEETKQYLLGHMRSM